MDVIIRLRYVRNVSKGERRDNVCDLVADRGCVELWPAGL